MDGNINTTLNYISLAEEIIIFAAKDYRKALRVLKKHPNNETALRKKKRSSASSVRSGLRFCQNWIPICS